MLDKAGYRANWEAKQAWYAAHGILPWTEGGGPNGLLMWSTEGVNSNGIDTQEIEHLATQVLDFDT